MAFVDSALQVIPLSKSEIIPAFSQRFQEFILGVFTHKNQNIYLLNRGILPPILIPCEKEVRQSRVRRIFMMLRLWPIFWTFFKVGILAYGGGQSMVPLLERECR